MPMRLRRFRVPLKCVCLPFRHQRTLFSPCASRDGVQFSAAGNPVESKKNNNDSRPSCDVEGLIMSNLTETTSAPWRIGVLFSRTGFMSVIEETQFQGTQLAIEEVNAS